MIIISYDIADNKLRTKFSRFISKFGYRLQYSVWRIDNSERILDNIANEINNKFLKKFDEEDSVYIFQMSKTCKITTYGYAKHNDESLIIIDRS